MKMKKKKKKLVEREEKKRKGNKYIAYLRKFEQAMDGASA